MLRDGGVAMTTLTRIKAKITPWDDRAFVQAFETARDEINRADMPDGPKAAARVEHLLHEAGYPNARVDVIRTAQEALAQTSHWIVTRDA
jgi:hypothetical protein